MTNRPIQPANAIGCSSKSWPAGGASTRSALKPCSSSGDPSFIPWRDSAGWTVECCRPTTTATTATTNPAIGPIAPISRSGPRLRIGERMLMNAPNVPMMNGYGGAGMKYGRLARTP